MTQQSEPKGRPTRLGATARLSQTPGILKMRDKRLGNTEVKIPEIGMGTWNYWGGAEPLRRAFALGATLVDTAESYGTEEIVGEAIRGQRSRVFVATKVSPRNFRRADLFAAVERTLRRLGTDYIDVYQLHWPNYTVPIEETMAAWRIWLMQARFDSSA